MRPVYIVYAKRTPIGRFGGALAPVRPDDLLAYLLRDLKNSIHFDPVLIDDVIVGCTNQAGEDNRNIARMSSILAGLPYEVPGVTVNRLCASSLDATIDATARISMGLADCIVIGGVESMSRGPMVISKSSSSYGRDHKMYDTAFGWRFPNPEMEKLFPLASMGETAENLYDIYNISREDQDLFALSSHQKALQAQIEGLFDDEILSIEVNLMKKRYLVEKDEGPRADTDFEKLSKLKPIFRQGGTVTAGNSSTLNDGAAALLLVSEEFLKNQNLTPLVQITGAGVRGVHPSTMGIGPVEAIRALCERYGYNVSDFDTVEINEAFAVQVLSCVQELNLDLDIVNPKGGAIALGHPLGCSGARILTTLTHNMNQDKSLKLGLATMCVGVGQGVSLSVENC